jgi:hypothetical protein
MSTAAKSDLNWIRDGRDGGIKQRRGNRLARFRQERSERGG